MSDKYFVDTNILMYAHDTSAGASTSAPGRSSRTCGVTDGCVSTQILQELCINFAEAAGRSTRAP